MPLVSKIADMLLQWLMAFATEAVLKKIFFKIAVYVVAATKTKADDKFLELCKEAWEEVKAEEKPEVEVLED